MMNMHELHKMSATGDEDGVFANRITNQKYINFGSTATCVALRGGQNHNYLVQNT